ncbi:MAG: alpha/beta fold hydrolase [Desulfobaccales bacterium]
MSTLPPKQAKMAIPCFRHSPCIDLAYYDVGAGEVLVLIHGLGANSTAWREQIGPLSASCRVIAMDLRGHGNSGHRPEGSITIRTFADDLISLLKGLGISQAHFCGNSLGGLISLEIWVRAPALLKSLILVGTMAFFPPPQMLKEFLHLFDHMEMTGWAGFMASRLLSPLAPASLVEELIEMISTVSREVYRQGLVAAFEADYRWMLPLIDLPTLIVVGAEDQATPAGYAKFLARQIPGSTLRMVPGAAHLPHREQPEAFNRLLQEHLEGCGTE